MSCGPDLPILTQILNHPRVDECVLYSNAGPGNYVIRLIGYPDGMHSLVAPSCFYRRMGDNPEILLHDALKYLNERFSQ